MAMVKAGISKSRIRTKSKAGRCRAGQPCGMPPYFEPTVATSGATHATMTVAATMATMDGGTARHFFGQKRMVASVSAPSPRALVFVCARWVARRAT